MPAEWVDVSAAWIRLESPLRWKDRPILRSVQQGWDRTGHYGHQADRPAGKTSDLWEEGEEGESLEE